MAEFLTINYAWISNLNTMDSPRGDHPSFYTEVMSKRARNAPQCVEHWEEWGWGQGIPGTRKTGRRKQELEEKHGWSCSLPALQARTRPWTVPISEASLRPTESRAGVLSTESSTTCPRDSGITWRLPPMPYSEGLNPRRGLQRFATWGLGSPMNWWQVGTFRQWRK